MRTPKKPEKSPRGEVISANIRAVKQISELPKDENWRTNAVYVHHITEKVLEICERTGLFPSSIHLASALGISNAMEQDVRSRIIPANEDVVFEMQQFHQMCEAIMSQVSLDGSANYASAIFALKAQYGYTEAPREIKITHNKLLGERRSVEEIAARYRESIVVDADNVREVDETALPEKESV